MQMSRWSMQQLLRAGEVMYATTTLFLLTQGPVYRLWSMSATYVPISPQPSVLHVYFATFTAAQIPALVILSRNINSTTFQARSFRCLVGLVSWLGLSLFWSMFARQSVPEFVALVMTTCFGVYLATRFTSTVIWWIVAVAMLLGMLLSGFAIWKNWDLATSVEEGYWAGIYFNRNSLAPVAAVALVATVGVFANSLKMSGVRRTLIVAFCVFTSFFAITLMAGARSRTSPFALSVAVIVVLVWKTSHWFVARSSRISQWRVHSLPVTVLVVGVAVFLVIRVVGGLLSVSGKTATFNSRGALWSVSWTGFLEKPLHGWGWMAAWRTPDFFRQGEWWELWNTEWSHNGYHDILLGGGIPAAVLFAGFLWFGLREVGSKLPQSESLATVLLVGFVLTAATQESFFIGSHFLWALLIAGLSVPFAQSLRSG